MLRLTNFYSKFNKRQNYNKKVVVFDNVCLEDVDVNQLPSKAETLIIETKDELLLDIVDRERFPKLKKLYIRGPFNKSLFEFRNNMIRLNDIKLDDFYTTRYYNQFSDTNYNVKTINEMTFIETLVKAKYSAE